MEDVFEEIDYYDRIFNLGIRNLHLSIPLRHLRDMQDPYDMSANQFTRRYRFSQETVRNMILPLIVNDLRKDDNRGLPIAPELQILICLRFYATASFQIVCGDLLNVSQPTVSNIVTLISKLLALKHNQFIRYPNNMTQNRLEFTRMGEYGQHQGLNNIDGAIDCTHIKIVNTPGVQHHETYRNRKSYFSINVQAVVGPNGYFQDIVARWAGSTHDSRIFQMSNINMKYRQGTHTGRLVGDSGYPCLSYLLTPIVSPANDAEEIYNKVHIRTRIIVERVFGQWKRRFPCLSRGLGNKLTSVSNIIVACAVLYNIGLIINDVAPHDHEGIDHNNEPEVPNSVTDEGTADGFAVRASIISNYNVN